MDIIAVQEAKKIKKSVGDIKLLETETRSNTVSAINELTKKVGRGAAPEVLDYPIGFLDTGSQYSEWIPFTGSCFIRGLKCTGDAFTGEFSLKMFTKPPNEGGAYVYYSGRVVNTLWDIMDIPFTDESGVRQAYVILENKGAPSNFNLQIYVLKG